MSLKVYGELADSSATSERSHSPVPFVIEIQDNGIIIEIPQDGERGCPVAEVYLEHYAGKLRMFAWDRNHFLNNGDPLCSLILLDDSSNRTMP